MEEEAILQHYRQFGLMTDPGAYRRLFDALPGSIPEVVSVVQGLLLHIFWASRYGLDLPDAKKEREVNLRSMVQMLDCLLEKDPSPLAQARPLEKRLIGNCRDFTVFTVFMLRHLGVAARARAGFATYFLPDHFEDHWVAEYWDAAGERWVMVDAQLDEFQQRVLRIAFNPLDIPAGQFWTGGKAWLACRRGEQDPEKFGIFNMHGLDFILGDLVRDFLALNNLEILPWDPWQVMDKPFNDYSADELTFFDRMAELTVSMDGSINELRALYQQDDRLHPPPGWQP